MNTLLLEKCDLLIKNRDAIHAAFRWDDSAMTLAGSSFYVGMGHRADVNKLKLCEEILKRHAGIFSEYRGNVKMPLLCKMAMEEDPEAYFLSVDAVVKQMRSLKWIDNSYKILAAITILNHTQPEQSAECVERMAELYGEMKREHPWLTADEDIPFAAMLAVSGWESAVLLNEMEQCYAVLKETFHDKDAVQSLSHVLSVDPAAAQIKCDRVAAIFQGLKEQKHKYSSGHELVVLGTLASLDISPSQAVSEIIEADDYLSQQKGFGDFAMGASTRRMYAALMVMDTHLPPASRSHESLLNTTLAMVIAMEICMVIMLTTVVASTAHS